MDRRCIKQFKQWLPKEHNNKVELVRVFTLFIPLKKIKIPFQTDQAGGKNLPFQTKTDTCGQGRSCIYPRIHSSRPSLLNGSDIVNLKHEVFMITSRFPSFYHNRDFPFILLFFFFS